MKKDVIWALIIGLTIGAVIAILAVRLPVFLEKKQQNENIAKNESPTPTVQLAAKIAFNIDSPSDNSVLDKSDIKINGSAPADSPLVVESADISNIVETDINGKFSFSLKLKEGGNFIYITSVDTSGNTDTKKLDLFYTPEKL